MYVSVPTQVAEVCQFKLLAICFVQPPVQTGKVFGFAEFVQAFALLAVVYTLSDVRYRFRVQTARLPVYALTFISCGLIGFGTLVSDFWFSNRLPTPTFLTEQTYLQAPLALLFMLTVLTWLWYGFLRPPIFGKTNFRKFARVLYSYLLRGSETELPQIAAELGRSAGPLVRFSINLAEPGSKLASTEIAGYAHDLLLLVANRKLCRAIVKEAPGTAIAFFDAATRHMKFRLPLGQFASNITTEALINKDSMLYHEDDGFRSGLIGYMKPFSRAAFGDYQLVEGLATSQKSPLDIDIDLRFSLTPDQSKAYCRAVIIAIEGYLQSARWGSQSYAIYRAFNIIEHLARDLHTLDENPKPYEADAYRQLAVAADFVRDVIKLLSEQPRVPETKLRHREEPHKREDLYDLIANLIFEMMFAASAVKSPRFFTWSVQHKTVWGPVFGIHKGKAIEIVQFKVRRLLYDEIRKMDKFLNYKSARVLGFCLNIFSLRLGDRRGYDRESYALRKVVLEWTKRRYLAIHMELPDVAAAALMDTITFDKKNGRLVKAYEKNLRRKAPVEYLDLLPAKRTSKRRAAAKSTT